MGIRPALYSSTSQSSASSSVNTSEKPNRPYTLPPTVAQLRNCTPTIWRTASRMAPLVAAFRAAWVSRLRSVAMAPMANSVSVSSMVSNPSADRSMAVPTLIFSIFSHSIPPSTRFGRFWFSCHASSSVAGRAYSRIVIIECSPFLGKIILLCSTTFILPQILL